jgi:hypothetical protein
MPSSVVAIPMVAGSPVFARENPGGGACRGLPKNQESHDDYIDKNSIYQ